jgi:hypothetical protein
MAKQLGDMEGLFKALADTTRLRILGLLLTGEVCVCDTRRNGLWIHYRLGKLGDPVLAAIVDAVRHALTHVDSVRRDGDRLEKRTGCCVPTPGEVAGVSCCAPQPVAVAAGRRHAAAD